MATQQKKKSARTQSKATHTRRPTLYKGVIQPLAMDHPQSNISLYAIKSGSKLYPLVSPGKGGQRPKPMLPQYIGLPVTVEAIEVQGVLHMWNIRLDLSLPDLEKLIILNDAPQPLTIQTRSTGTRTTIQGQWTQDHSNLYQKEGEAILVGFKGTIEPPRKTNLQIDQQDIKKISFQTLEPLSAELAPPATKITTTDDLLKVFKWSTRETDKPYFFGPYPYQDPQVLQFLDHQARINRMHELFDLDAKQVRKQSGEDCEVRMGELIGTEIGVCKEPIKVRNQMWQGVRNALCAKREDLLFTARAVSEYRVQNEIEEQMLERDLMYIQTQMENTLREEERILREQEEGSSLGWWTALGLIGGCAAGYYTGNWAYSASQLKALMMSLGGGLIGGLVGSVADHANHLDVLKRQSDKISQISQDLTRIRDMRTHSTRLREDGMYQRVIEGVIGIMAENDRELHDELQRANSPEEREWIHKKIEYRLRNRYSCKGVRAQSARSPHQVLIVDGILKRSPNKFASGFVGMSEEINGLLEKGQRAAKARKERLLDGFSNIKVKRPKDEPEWLWD